MTEDEYTVLRAQLSQVGRDLDRRFASDESLLQLQRTFLEELWTMQGGLEAMIKQLNGVQDAVLAVTKAMQKHLGGIT
jgi:uncharacterized protein YhjY with autotransporter beta-barrel domain